MSRIHEYFKRNYTDWNIIGFLEESDEETFDLKIDSYLKSLELITEGDQEGRAKKAQLLFDKYKKARKKFFLL